MIKEALQYVAGLAAANEKPEIIEICGRTYANKDLKRYDPRDKAEPIRASTLSSLLEYITECSREFPFGKRMIVHIVNPKEVRLMTELDGERQREQLFAVKAETSEFSFDHWYDQERFMVELQANFQMNEDLAVLMKAAGNIEKKNNQTYSDDGVTQVATMTVGIASKADVIVPNPVELIPYRTFLEVEQPASKFVFRISDREESTFKLIEAQGGIWKIEAIDNIKEYLYRQLAKRLPEEMADRIIIIG